MLKGIYTALITPYNQQGIDYDLLKKLVNKQLNSSLSGIVLFGTTGEGNLLSLQEKINIIIFVKKMIKNKMTLIVNIGSNNPVDLAHDISCLPLDLIDYLMIITPYYVKGNKSGLIKYFAYIASRSPLPIIIYHVPSRTNIDIDEDCLLQLSRINNIYGIKDASENLNLLNVKNHTSDFAFLSGNDENIIPYLLNGGDGLISVISNIYPQEMCNIYQEIINKNITIAQQVFDKLVNLMKMLFVETNPIPIKELIYFIYHQQLDFRLPLDHILLENKEKIIKCFQEVNDEYPYSW